MKKFILKPEVKRGSQRYCPGVGHVTLTDLMSDALAEKFVDAGIELFDLATDTNNGKEESDAGPSTGSGTGDSGSGNTGSSGTRDSGGESGADTVSKADHQGTGSNQKSGSRKSRKQK